MDHKEYASKDDSWQKLFRSFMIIKQSLQIAKLLARSNTIQKFLTGLAASGVWPENKEFWVDEMEI